MKPWVLVTGAARRIGRVIALDLAKAGWNIVIHYNTSQKEALSLAKEIQELKVDTCLAELDLDNGSLVEKLIPSLIAEIPALCALVNNASLFETDPYDLDGSRHTRVNFEAPRLLSETLHRYQNKKAVIVNILDTDPTKPEFTAYNRSKRALHELTLSNALTFAPRTRVNGVAIGPVLRNERESPAHFQSNVEKTLIKYQPTPEDVASSVRCLIENISLTGNILYADAGLHLLKNEKLTGGK